MKITELRAVKCLQKILITLLYSSIIMLAPANSNATVISELYITEVMANPSQVSDSNGEWFEIYNPTNEIFDLNGITLSDNGSNSHLINNPDPLLIDPGQYFVLGKNDDELTNGGYTVDYQYSGFTLGNTDDEIILTDIEGNILSLLYENGFVTDGKSSELLSTYMQLSNYSFTEISTYGLGDYGTPGSAGTYQFTTASVPEPSSLWLALAGSIMFCRKRKKN